MNKYEEYFEKIKYKPKYHMGERVFGKWNKIPFMGKVGIDALTSEAEGPKVIIFLDLPILYKKKWYKMITVKHKDIKPVVSIDKKSKKK